MKKIIFSLSLSLIGLFTHAQNGLEQVIVEKYYVSNAADSLAADVAATDAGYALGALPVGSVTYRVYADMLPGWKMSAVYGNPLPVREFRISTTTSFYNNPFGSVTQPSIAKAGIKNNIAALDSWLSVGGACNGNFGILKSEDPGGTGTNANNITTASNPDNVLLNNDPAAGIPLTTQDGLYALAGVQPITLVGFTTETDIFGDGSIVGDTLLVSDASYASLNGSEGPIPATNRVLIGQFTTDGAFSFELNIQIVSADMQKFQKYVAKNPDTTEIQIPSLIYPPVSSPPTINVTYPLNNAKYVTGDTDSIKAVAGDIDGTVSKVEFFMNGVSTGTVTAPYKLPAYTYTAAGTYTLTAVATDNTSLATTSTSVLIYVSDNTAPNVSITAPANNATAYVGDVITIKADAIDANSHTGSKVAWVDFFIDGIKIGRDSTPGSGSNEYSHTYTCTAGTHTLTTVASDERNATTTSAAVLINVVTGVAPTVSISSPINNSSVSLGDDITIVATANDPDGTIASVEFFIDAISLGMGTIVTNGIYTIPYKVALPKGIRLLRAKATDNTALTTTSVDVQINVLDSTTIGVNDLNASEEMFTVYPNPTQNTITIAILSKKGAANHYTIYGMEGNVIVHKELGAVAGTYTETIDISSLANGQYIIALSIDGITSAKTIIKE